MDLRCFASPQLIISSRSVKQRIHPCTCAFKEIEFLDRTGLRSGKSRSKLILFGETSLKLVLAQFGGPLSHRTQSLGQNNVLRFPAPDELETITNDLSVAAKGSELYSDTVAAPAGYKEDFCR
jgi:hypothetical protein